jgi:hypothetical protein
MVKTKTTGQSSLWLGKNLRNLKIWVTGFVALFLFISTLVFPVLAPNTATAATSSTLNFQARLLAASGALVADGTYNIEFKLYDSSAAGASAQGVCVGGGTDDCLWVETRTGGNKVTVVNGYLSVNLASVTSFGALDWDQEMWLTMNIGGTGAASWDGEMTPRIKLTAVPYAFKAGTALGVSSNATSTASTNSGNVSVGTGNATGATSNSGNLTIDVGTATGTAGTISVGTANTTAITIGRTGVTTTNSGALTVAQLLTGQLGATISGATTSINASSNFATNINTGTSNGAVTIGGGSGTFALDSTAFDVSTAGALSGITGYSQASGNFLQSGTGTFGTGTGAVSLNGDTTVAAGKSLTIATGSTFTNASSTLNTAIAISNVAGGGNIGTAAATVDVATTFSVNQTTASQTLTLPSPTVTTAGRIVYVSNVGSTSFSMYSKTVATGTTEAFIWNGSAWTGNNAAASSGVTTVGTIDTQTKSSDGAVISGSSIYLQTADASNVGLVSTSTQTFAGAKTFSSLVTASAGVTISTGSTFTNASSTLFTAISVSNLPTGGAIGTAAATVDVATTFTINQTTASQTLTLPNPTTATAGRIAYVANVGSVTFSMHSVNIQAGATAIFLWNGTAWTVAGLDGAGGNYIQNQSASDQTADFRISGTGRANTALQAPLFDTPTATTLNIGTTNATGIALNQSTTITGNLSFAVGSNRTISVATQTSSNTAGNNLTVNSAAGNGTGAGGTLTLQAGSGGSTAGAAGGATQLLGGAGSSTGSGGAGGAVTITGGTAQGDGTTGRAGGAVTITGGTSVGTQTGGAVTIQGGAATVGQGGTTTVAGGAGGLTGAGGTVAITSGTAGASAGAAGGAITITASNGTSTTTGGIGGSITVNAGNAGGTGDNNGGSITFGGGAATGNGSDGSIIFKPQSGADSAYSVLFQNAAGSNILAVDTSAQILQPGSQGVVSTQTISNNTSSPGLGTPSYFAVSQANDGLVQYLNKNTGNDALYFTKCLNSACSTRTTTTALTGAVAVGATDYSVVTQANGLPMIWYEDDVNNRLEYIRCGNDTCTSGNAAPVIANSTNTPGSQASAIIAPNGNVWTFYKTITGSTNDLYVTKCNDSSCSTDTDVAVYTTGNVGDAAQPALSYCSESDRAAARNPNACVLVASIVNSTSDDIALSLCNADCSSATSTVIDEAYDMGSNNNSNNVSLVMLPNGVPVIFRLITGNRIEVIKCDNLSCASPTSSILVNGTAGTSGFGAALGKDGLPIVSYDDQTSTYLTIIQCGSESCDPALSLNTTTSMNGSGGMPTVSNGSASNIVIGGDGFPFIVSRNSSTFNHTHCVDLSCSQSSVYGSGTTGISLGAISNPFARVYAKTINDGDTSASFSVDSNGLVIANSLRSDTAGNVTIASNTTTSLNVKNASTGVAVFTVDSYNGNVGIGDSTPDAKLDVETSSTSTTAGTFNGQLLTVSDTGVVTSGTDTTGGLTLAVTRTGATGGTINTNGLTVTVTADNAGAGTSNAYGQYVTVNGADNNYAAYYTGTGSLSLVVAADSDNVTESDQPQILLSQDGGLISSMIGYEASENDLTIQTKNALAGVGNLNLGTNDTNRLVITYAGNATYTNGTTGDALTINNSTSTGDVLELQDNGSAVFTVADGGGITGTGTYTFSGVTTDITTGTNQDLTLVANGSGTISLNDTVTVVNLLTAQAGATITGATTSINASSNFDTNINSGTSTGAVTIGNTSAGAISVQSGSTISIGTTGGTPTIGRTGVTTSIAGALTVTQLTTLNGGLTIEAGDNFTINGDVLTDLTGTGLVNSGGALTVDATSATGFFQNGGNSFSAAAVVGTNDANSLSLETSGTTRLSIASGGAATYTGGTSGDAFTINNSTSTGDILALQDNGVEVFSVADGGGVTAAGLITAQLGLTASGAITSINASSNFATNINTGTSTGAVSIGNSAGGSIAVQSASTIGLTGTTTVTGLTAGVALTINNSTSTGNILSAQDNGTNVFVVADGGYVGIGTGSTAPTADLTFGTDATRTITVLTQDTAATAGSDLTIRAATGNTSGIGGTLTLQGGTGGSTAAGGALVISGGNAGGGNTNGGNVTISGGTGSGSGVQGLVVLTTPTFDTSTVQNFTSSAAITQANIDSKSAILISANAAGYTATLSDPTTSTAGRLIYVTNSGSYDMTLAVNGGGAGNEITLKPNTTATMIWNGSDWTAAGASSSTDLQAAYDNTATSAGGAELVLNAPGGSADGLTIRNNDATPITGGILEVQTSIGSNLLSVNNNATEYANNGGAESSTFTMWTDSSSGALETTARSTTANTYATGQASALVVTTGVATQGIKNTLSTTLTNSLEYQVSFAIKAASTAFTALDVMYSYDGSTTNVRHCISGTPYYSTGTASQTTTTITGVGTTFTAAMVGKTFVFANGTSTVISGYTSATVLTAATSQTVSSQNYAIYTEGFTVNTGIWSRVTCTFTAPAVGTTITSSNAIMIRQTDTTTRTFYVDNLSVTVSADVNHAVDGSVDDSTNFATNWQDYDGGAGSTTEGYETTNIYDTSASVSATTTANADQGLRNNMLIRPSVSTQYLVTFYGKLASGTFTDLRVRYTRDGGTNFVSCGDYSTQTLTTSTWTEVTCIFTTDSSTPTDSDLIIDQPTGTARTFYIDALSVTLNTNTASNVQIGGANKGGPTTLLTLDRSSSAPIAANNEAYLGSMYYDTTTGRIQCYEADGWGACGAAPDNVVNLNPEFAGAVLNGTGVGTMTADSCGNGGGLSLNTSLCASGEARNYYKWTSPQASQQTYSIYVTYQLPASFKNFASDDTIQLTARTDSTSNAAVTYEMFRSQSGSITQCGSGETAVVTTVDTWQTVGINGNESTGCSFSTSSANAFIIFKINLKANSNANAYVGTLAFTTTGN